MSTIIREFENVQERCSTFLEGVQNKNTQLLKELDSFMSDVFDYEKKSKALPPQIDTQKPFFYNFLRQIIPAMLKNCSPGAVGVFSIYVIQFVGYCVERDIFEYMDLLEMFFNDQAFLQKFEKLNKEESDQYNTIMSGATDGYIARPTECLFGKKRESGIDFIALTVQNFGKRAYFSICFQKILRCESFSTVEPIISFLQKTVNSMDPSFRKFVANWFVLNLTNVDDERYSTYKSIYLPRFIFSLAEDEDEEKVEAAGQLYYQQLNLAANAGDTRTILVELDFITKKHCHCEVLDEFLAAILNLILGSDINLNQYIIIQTALYLKDCPALDRAFLYSKISSNLSIVKELFPIISPVVNIPELYEKLRQDITNQYQFLMTILPFCDPQTLPTLGEDFVQILYLIPKEDLQVFLQICVLPQFVELFVKALSKEITNPNLNFQKFDLICSACDVLYDKIQKQNEETNKEQKKENEQAEENAEEDKKEETSEEKPSYPKIEFDWHQLFLSLINSLMGDQLITIFENHKSIPVDDLPALVRSANLAKHLAQYLRENFFSRVLEIAPYLPTTYEAGELILDAFFEANHYSSWVDPPKDLIHREAIWIILFTALVTDSPSLLESISSFITRYIAVNPTVAFEDICSLAQSSASGLLANALRKVDLSWVPADSIAERIDQIPSILIVLHALPQKAKIEFNSNTISEMSRSNVSKICYYLDAAEGVADDSFYRQLKPLTQKIIDAFAATSDNIGYLYTLRHIALYALRKMNINVPLQNLNAVFEFAATNGFVDLAQLCLDMINENYGQPDDKIVLAALSRSSKQCAQFCVDTLLNAGDVSKNHIIVCLKCATGDTLVQIISKTKQWTDDLAAEAYARFKQCVTVGSATKELVEVSLKKIPLLPGIEMDLAPFFFSSKFPPNLRTKKAIINLFRRYKHNCSGFLKFIESINPQSISLFKTGLEPFPQCPSLNAIVQCLSSFNLLLRFSVTQTPISPYIEDFAKLIYGSYPFIKSTFSKQEIFKDSSLSPDAVLQNCLDLLPSSIKDLFDFTVVFADDEKTPVSGIVASKMNCISVNLVDAYTSFLNSFFKPKSGKARKLDHGPPMLCIRFIPPTSNSELKPMSVPAKVDFREFIANSTDGIYDLHGIVSFSRSDRQRYTAYIRTEDNDFIKCTDQYCEKVSNIPTTQLPEILFYRRSLAYVDRQRMYSKLPQHIKETVNPANLAVTKTLEMDVVSFKDFQKNKQYYFLVCMLVRKFKMFEPFKELCEDADFSKVFFESALDIICNQSIFDELKFNLTQLASLYPNPEELRKQIEQAIHAPKIGENVMTILFSLKLSPESIWSVIQNLKEMKNSAASNFMFAEFVEPLFAPGIKHDKAKHLIRDPVFCQHLIQKKLPNFTQYYESHKK